MRSGILAVMGMMAVGFVGCGTGPAGPSGANTYEVVKIPFGNVSVARYAYPGQKHSMDYRVNNPSFYDAAKVGVLTPTTFGSCLLRPMPAAPYFVYSVRDENQYYKEDSWLDGDTRNGSKLLPRMSTDTLYLKDTTTQINHIDTTFDTSFTSSHAVHSIDTARDTVYQWYVRFTYTRGVRLVKSELPASVVYDDSAKGFVLQDPGGIGYYEIYIPK